MNKYDEWPKVYFILYVGLLPNMLDLLLLTNQFEKIDSHYLGWLKPAPLKKIRTNNKHSLGKQVGNFGLVFSQTAPHSLNHINHSLYLSSLSNKHL